MLPVFLSPFVTVISCRTDRATKAGFSRQNGRVRCEYHETAIFPEGAAGQNGWMENTCAMIHALRPKVSEKSPVILVLPPPVTLLRHLRIPRVDARKRARMVAFEAGQAIPCALDEVVWDSVLSGENKTTQDMLLVTAKLGVIEPLCAAAQAAGFTLQQIVPSSLAMLAAFRLVRPECSEPELLLNFEAGAVTLLLLAGGNFAVRSLLVGNVEAGDPEGLAGRVASEVTRSVLFFQRQCDMGNPVRLLLSGAGAQQRDFGMVLERRLKISVERLETGAIAVVGAEAGNPDNLTELAGAAALLLRPGRTAVNLLPPRLRTQQRRRRRRPCLVAAALLALAAPVGPLIHFHGVRQVAANKSREMDRVIAPLRAKEERVRSNLAQLAELERQIASWQAVQDRRTTWLELLADLQDRLGGVEDVWFEKMRLVPATKDAPLKLAVTGRMLERTDPLAKSGPGAVNRVTALLTTLKRSPFVAAVENERFDGSQPGMLAFEFVLVTGGTRSL